MGEFRVPLCAIVHFTKLVLLARNETDGLMRQISDAAVTLIREDMIRVGVLKETFGRPTINISCEVSDAMYRSLFHPVPSEALQLINEELEFLNLEGVPVILPTAQHLPNLSLTDGRHRVMACSEVVPIEKLRNTFVLCYVTNIKDPLGMKQDSFRKSELRPLVFNSIHDILVCLPQWESGNTSKIREAIRTVLKIPDKKKAQKIELLHCHMFEQSKRLLDSYRDSKIFSRENVFRRCSVPFISFIKETGKGQYSGYRYELRAVFKPESGLKIREMVQVGVIKAMVYIAKSYVSIGALEVLANTPNMALARIKEYKHLLLSHLVQFFVELLKEMLVFFREKRAGDMPLLTKSVLEKASTTVLVEGLGLENVLLQEYFNRCTNLTGAVDPRSHSRDGNFSNKNLEKEVALGTSTDFENEVYVSGTKRRTSNRKRKRDETLDDGDKKGKKKRGNKKDSLIRKKLRTKTMSVSPGAKAVCAAKCLDYSEEFLQHVHFFEFICRGRKHVISGLKKLKTPTKAILCIDAPFLKKGKKKEAVAALSCCNIETEMILVWSTEEITENSMEIPGFAVKHESILSVASSEGDGKPGVSYFAHVLLPLRACYEGPKSTRNNFNHETSAVKVFKWFFSMASICLRKSIDSTCLVWADFTAHSHVTVLENLIEQGFGAGYYKILSGNGDDGLKYVDCLLAIRRKISAVCTCGGHSILSVANQATLNELQGGEMSCGSGEIHGEYHFIMHGHGEDKMPNGNVMEHTSLLLKRNVLGETPAFAQDSRLLCCSKRDEKGMLLHRGAFVTKETFEKLKITGEKIELILPSTVLLDKHTKREKYPFCISEFEMRDLFVSGVTDQLFSVIFHDNSIASLFNEGAEHSEVSFTARYRSAGYLDILYREGLQAIKRPEMCLIFCELDSSTLKVAERRGLQCENCKAVELLTYYGSEYTHE